MNKCDICENKTNKQCNRCFGIYYCGRKCQKKDWKKHKKFCGKMISSDIYHKHIMKFIDIDNNNNNNDLTEKKFILFLPILYLNNSITLDIKNNSLTINKNYYSNKKDFIHSDNELIKLFIIQLVKICKYEYKDVEKFCCNEKECYYHLDGKQTLCLQIYNLFIFIFSKKILDIYNSTDVKFSIHVLLEIIKIFNYMKNLNKLKNRIYKTINEHHIYLSKLLTIIQLGTKKNIINDKLNKWMKTDIIYNIHYMKKKYIKSFEDIFDYFTKNINPYSLAYKIKYTSHSFENKNIDFYDNNLYIKMDFNVLNKIIGQENNKYKISKKYLENSYKNFTNEICDIECKIIELFLNNNTNSRFFIKILNFMITTFDNTYNNINLIKYRYVWLKFVHNTKKKICSNKIIDICFIYMKDLETEMKKKSGNTSIKEFKQIHKNCGKCKKCKRKKRKQRKKSDDCLNFINLITKGNNI
jgi:hypothetical protein